MKRSLRVLLLSSVALVQAEEQQSPASVGGLAPSSTTITSKATSGAINTLTTLSGAALNYAVTTAETAASLTPVSLNYPVGNAWRYLTAAQIANAVARTLSLDDAAALNNGIKAAWVSGVADYIPRGAYSVSASLNLPGILTENRGNAFVMYGDGAGDPFSVASFTSTTDIIGSGTTIPLYIHQYLGAGTGTPNMEIRDIRFEANNTTSVISADVLSESVIKRCTVLQSGTGDGIDVAFSVYNTFQDVMVMNSGKVTTGGTKTGTGIYITQAGGDAGLTTIGHSLSAGWLNSFKIGDGSHPIENTKIVDSAAQAATNGVVVSSGANKTVIDNLYSENISGTVVQDNGNYTTVRDSFFFPGFTIGIDGTNAGASVGGSASYSGNVFEMGVANAFGIKASGAAGPTPKSVGIKDNSLYYSGRLSNVVGIVIAGASPLIQMEGNTFYPGTAWTGSGSYQVIDSSTALGLIGKTVDTGSSYSFPLLANSGLQLSYTGNSLTASSVSAGVMTLPVESIIYINEPSTPTIVSSFAATRPRIVVLYLNNSNITFVNSAYNTLSAPYNSTHGTLTLWLQSIGGQMYAHELARMDDAPTAPTLSSGFGISPSIQSNSGAKSFSVNVGAGGAASSGVVGLPTAPHGWACHAHDNTTSAGNVEGVVTTRTTATITNYSRTSGIAAAWRASDVLEVGCVPN